MYQLCITCNKQISDAIRDDSFYGNMLAVFSPFIVMTLIVTGIGFFAASRYHSNSPVPVTAAASVIGIGLGAFIDGVVLHQILQWHEMISGRLPPVDFVSKSVNMFWDGVFHAFALLYTLAGVLLLHRAMRQSHVDRSFRVLTGGMIMGWGLFNLGEGLIDHHLLKLHNVREVAENPTAWNLAFLLFSVVLLVAGFLLVRHRKLV